MGTSKEPTITRQEVEQLSRLAVIDLTEDEIVECAEQLDVILKSVAGVSALAEADIVPTTHAVGLVNITRDDAVRPGLANEAALAAAPAAEAGMYRVPQILGEEQ